MDEENNTIDTYKDSQFINTCAVFRKLKIIDLDGGRYDLEKTDTPAVNLGYQVIVEPKPADGGVKIIHGEAMVITMNLMGGASGNFYVSTIVAGVSLLLLSAF